MDADGLRTKYERIHFKESDTNKGKLKQGYAKWLEKELIEQLNLHRVIKSQNEARQQGFGDILKKRCQRAEGNLNSATEGMAAEL
tara:strand:- start:510 stop:764 length:255 start_codon:yes stop_codon:yes gene_type:complete